MNRNCKILFLCFFLIIFYGINTGVWADEEIFRHPLTPQTRAVFNAACFSLSERPIVRGNFAQEKYLNRLDRSLMSSGNFLITAEHGMVWETLQPFPSTMIMGKEFIMQSRPNGQKSVISSQGNETFAQMADVINAVFSGQSDRLLENFEVFFLGSVSNWNMGLLPRDSVFSSFITKITMSGGSAIRSIRIFEQNGDVITYTLTNHNYPAALNDNEKAFFTIP
ncbi:MAG: outer membrane lipoprotein carrier protein LolA [Treponema sp.]|nr:outer membrane lipoprotein carrier protein LolA [Treponema sp.]